MSIRTAAVLALALAVVAGAALAWRSRAPAPTDEQLIQALLDGAARAAEEKRVGDVADALSERFRGEGLDRDGARRLVAFHVLRGEWVGASISGSEIVVEGDRARANVDAVLSRAAGKGRSLSELLPGEASAHRFACRLAREDGGWRVVEARWRPISLAEALAGPPRPDAKGD